MFSVIIPYYNKSKYIQRCLDAVLNQTFQEFEIILVNDGSTDNGLHFILDNYPNTITVINQENKGVSAARNTGIQQAKYPFIAFLDADDCWHNQFLEKIKTVIDAEKDIKIIGTHYSRNKKFLTMDSGTLDYFKFENYFKSALKNTYFSSSSTIITTDFFTKDVGFNTYLKKGEDIDIWIRAVQSGGNAFYIKNTLVYYSDEDANQATNSKGSLQTTLVGAINEKYQNLLKSSEDEHFNRFVSVYVYFNLYPYYYGSESHLFAKAALIKNEYQFFLLNLVYTLPLRVGIVLLKSNRFSKWIRLYMKFVIRFILN
ncbi:glycosyltransferase family 2 protein [Flavobacterium sp. XS2P39]|uniref:glycosyltransferase family 2 protein n=1 Tax=Flavobacterium sp. XS2P39 TaxID=3401725 RepID=UPI003AAD3AA1